MTERTKERRIVSRASADRELVGSLASDTGLSELTAQILVSRDIVDADSARAFLSPTLREQLPDPAQLLNIDAAADLVLDFCESKKPITIFTDFDVDGLTSGAQLFLFLRAIGAQVSVYTPNRFEEGYGLNLQAVQKLAGKGTELLVTVDCGISSNAEIGLAKSLGLETLVIDHHHVSALPDATVVIDPEQTGCGFHAHKLCAAGIVWIFLIHLRRKLKERNVDSSSIPDPKLFLDLAALGTICDMVPLQGLNRLIAHRGLEVLKTSSRPGIEALKRVSGVSGSPRFGAGHVGFMLGPRINAAGRMDDGSLAFELLITSDTSKAEKLAQAIDRLNTERRSIEERLREACIKEIEEKNTLAQGPAIAIYQEDFHPGIIGIAAQRLVELYHVPAAVMAASVGDVNGKQVRIAKGSVRGIDGFHVADVLSSLDDILLAHGGHAKAGGFSVALDSLEEFKERFVTCAADTLSEEQLVPELAVDGETLLTNIDFKTVDEIGRLAPFGIGNPTPVLVSRDLVVDAATPVGNKHLRLKLSDSSATRVAVAWGYAGNPLLRKGTRIGVAYQPEINWYRGVSSVQLNVKEVWKED